VTARLLLRTRPLSLVMLAVELALVACVGVFAVYPPDPEPVAREVVWICRKTDVVCTELLAEAKAIEAREVGS
jgi:hypothetical protein